MSEQQEQTKKHFVNNANSWRDRAENKTQTDGVIQTRMESVLSVIDKCKNVSRFLDVGCGTGELVIEAGNRGIESLGVDFSEELIAVCEQNRLSSSDPKLISFEACSFFDIQVSDNQFDLISALGFIEYLSLEELDAFIDMTSKFIKDNGVLVLASRNRLFNVFSMNDFTEAEIVLGTLNDLVSEAMFFGRSSSMEEALENILPFQRQLAHPEKHPKTHVQVETRYQFTPGELIARLAPHGFEPKDIYPVNFHGLPPRVKKQYHDVHLQLSATMRDKSHNDPRLLPQCSTFVLELRKSKS